MARAPRQQEPGSLHHVTVRGNDGAAIFVDDDDRRSYLAAVATAVEIAGWQLLSYCLMRNHAHLLVKLGRESLSLGMHVI